MRVRFGVAFSLLAGARLIAGCGSDDTSNASTTASTTGSAGANAAGAAGAPSVGAGGAGAGGTGATGGGATGGSQGTQTGGSGGTAMGGAAGAMEDAAAGNDGAGGQGMADAGSGDEPTDGSSNDASGGTPIFDGRTLDGWDGVPGIWSVKDGAIDGASNTPDKFAGTFLASKGDYGNFRLMLTERVVVSNDHLGVCMWGNRLAAGNGGAGKCLVVIPPDGSMWDYGSGAIHGAKVGNAGVDSHTWHNVEIVAHRDTGEILMAVNGVQVTKYKDANPSRLPNGPIRLQLHAWTGAQEVQYKDITIETNPKDYRLITVH